MRECGKGHAFNPENTFLKKNGCRECITCRKEYRKSYYEANREKLIRAACDRQKKKPEISITRHGISNEDYQNLLKEQGNCCASCKSSNPAGSRFIIDHDHKCCPGTYSCGKCVRGLICSTCNKIAGMIESSRFEGVKNYLEGVKNASTTL